MLVFRNIDGNKLKGFYKKRWILFEAIISEVYSITFGDCLVKNKLLFYNYNLSLLVFHYL